MSNKKASSRSVSTEPKRKGFSFSLDCKMYAEICERVGGRCNISRVVEECIKNYFPIYEALHLRGTKPIESIEKRSEYQTEDLTKAMAEAFSQALKQHFEQGGSKHE